MAKNEYTLHKLPQEFVITSNEVIEEKSNFLENNTIFTCRNIFENGIEDDNGLLHKTINCKKVIAQQNKIDFSKLSQKDQDRIGWLDWRKYWNLDNNRYGAYSHSYFLGFKKREELLSDKKFTLEDMRFMYESGLDGIGENSEFNEVTYFDYLISKINSQSWKVELEKECSVCGRLSGTGHKMSCKNIIRHKQPKLTNGKITILKLI